MLRQPRQEPQKLQSVAQPLFAIGQQGASTNVLASPLGRKAGIGAFHPRLAKFVVDQPGGEVTFEQAEEAAAEASVDVIRRQLQGRLEGGPGLGQPAQIAQDIAQGGHDQRIVRVGGGSPAGMRFGRCRRHSLQKHQGQGRLGAGVGRIEGDGGAERLPGGLPLALPAQGQAEMIVRRSRTRIHRHHGPQGDLRRPRPPRLQVRDRGVVLVLLPHTIVAHGPPSSRDTRGLKAPRRRATGL
nr:hypothetical protein [Caulobacter endophyticus]